MVVLVLVMLVLVLVLVKNQSESQHDRPKSTSRDHFQPSVTARNIAPDNEYVLYTRHK